MVSELLPALAPPETQRPKIMHICGAHPYEDQKEQHETGIRCWQLCTRQPFPPGEPLLFTWNPRDECIVCNDLVAHGY